MEIVSVKSKKAEKKGRKNIPRPVPFWVPSSLCSSTLTEQQAVKSNLVLHENYWDNNNLTFV